MSTRRQSSTTSLSKYARVHSPIPQNRSLDFCNAFWGLNDAGVDVLFARMRGAVRTMEELKNFWKERATIEEDYAKRLAKLAKMTLGRDEIGELRNSLDTVRLETDKQAGYHLTLAQQIRNDLEAQANVFYNKQMHHKKAYQSVIEKEFKAKQLQESYVAKARDKYEADCVRINSFAAQSSIIQGRELEKVTQRLERAQQTVQANERDFANFAKALQDTVQKWEQNWKSFGDSCQDLEELRIEFMKDNMWAYANAVSTVCVADDESCEKIRLALEILDPDRDMENFVRDYGTGNHIPDPPQFVNYNTSDAIPSSSSKPSTRPAQFNRNSQRELPRQAPAPVNDEPIVNTAGIGAGGGLRRADTQNQAALNRQSTQRNGTPGTPAQLNPSQINGASTNSGPPSPEILPDHLAKRRSTIYQAAELPSARSASKPDPQAEPIDPTAETYIKVGNSAYKVWGSQFPQAGPSNSRAQSTSASTRPEGSIDPLARQLEELKIAVQNSGSGRRNTIVKSPQDSWAAQSSPRKSMEPVSNSSVMSPSVSSSQNQGPTAIHDYRNSAELVVGAHPSASRSTSPNTPMAAFMVPKPSSPPSTSDVMQKVVSEYGQSLPGERRSISRSNSRRSSHVPQGSSGSVNPGQNLARPPSQVGRAGIGAHGGSRSASPQPPASRGPSPGPSRNSYIAPPPPQNVNRAPSPNSVGIALDPSGRVLHDDMARWYEQQKQQAQYQPPQPPQQRPSAVQQQQAQYNSPLSTPAQSVLYRQNVMNPVNSHPQIPASPMQANYGNIPPAPAYQPPQSAAGPSPPQGYMPPGGGQPLYNSPMTYQAPPPVHQAPPQQEQMYQSHPYQVPNGLQRGGSLGGAAPYYTNGAVQPQQSPVYNGQMYHHQQPSQTLVAPPGSYTDVNLMGRSPSPQPQTVQTIPKAPPQQLQMQRGTGQTTEEGTPILFYVKALYDYTATIEEEFDFQAGDIIAVTATPDDGWWSGVLLDEVRRQRGRHVFPSNFVCLF
ncbi:hypothetical protein AX15_004334 [Amanita polypyramis BW_CC]|nr:hypothetical protein AX15_004334 [Amanita polypyramis BW_CC]